MTERQCRFCKELLSLDSFYVSDKWKCKDCRKALTKKNRADKPDYYKHYDRERSELDHRVQARKEYQKTEAYKLSRLSVTAKYRENHPNKYKCQTAVGNALRLGKLQRYPCIICGDPKSQGHHEDYDKPLDVTWLCDRHHKARHAQLREYERDGGDYPAIRNIPF